MTERLSLLLLLFLVACPAQDPPEEEEPTPEPTPPCNEGLPEPSTECLPECGNELQVGQPCTEGGGECYTGVFEDIAWLCTVDAYETDLWFCTMPCQTDEDCGSDAICTGDPDNDTSGRGCFPIGCADGDDDDSADDDDSGR